MALDFSPRRWAMRIAARCRQCGRDFLFFQLYNAPPGDRDHCPHCGTHLGIVNLAPLALDAERAGDTLARCLDEVAARSPEFDLYATSVLEPLRKALAKTAPEVAPEIGTLAGRRRRAA